MIANTAVILSVASLLTPALAAFVDVGPHGDNSVVRRDDGIFPRHARDAMTHEGRRIKREHKKKRSCKVKSSSVSATAAATKTSDDDSKATVVVNANVRVPTTTASPTTTAKSTKTNSNPAASTGLGTPSSSSAYTLQKDYSGKTFFDDWNFFTHSDPTHGMVNYVSSDTAWSKGLVGITDDNTATLKVDSSTWLSNGANRDSVRIVSKDTFSSGSMVVIDANKIPYGNGVWPAFWSTTTDKVWPAGGEFDIIEQVNDNPHNQYTLHSTAGCYLKTPMAATGTILVEDCIGSAGCGVLNNRTNTFGSGFNRNGGGVVVLVWEKDTVSFYQFPRDGIPSDIASGSPTMEGWGSPVAYYDGDSCDFDKYFTAQNLIINITLCGDWAGNDYVWRTAGNSGTCAASIANPDNFSNAVWDISYVRVYKQK